MNSIDPIAEVEAIVARARTAQNAFERGGSQNAYDRAAQAAAWAIMVGHRRARRGSHRDQGRWLDHVERHHRTPLSLRGAHRAASTRVGFDRGLGSKLRDRAHERGRSSQHRCRSPAARTR